MATYPLLLGHSPAGELQTRQEGLFTVLEAVLYPPKPGIYRIWAVGDRGRVLLGVPEPSGRGELRLRRRLSRRELEPAGELSEALALTHEGELHTWQSWTEGDGPKGPFAQRLRGHRGLLWRRFGSGWEIALPFVHRRPMPLPELFCLARIVLLGEGLYVVYRFDRQGVPCL